MAPAKRALCQISETGGEGFGGRRTRAGRGDGHQGHRPGKRPDPPYQGKGCRRSFTSFRIRSRHGQKGHCRIFRRGLQGPYDGRYIRSPASPGEAAYALCRMPPPGHLLRREAGLRPGGHKPFGHRVLHPRFFAPPFNGGFCYLHGCLCELFLWLCPGNGSKGGLFYRGFHLFSLGRHWFDQRGTQQPQVYPGDHGQRHHRHDRAPTPPGRGHRTPGS